MNVYSFIQMIDSDLVYSDLYPGTLGLYLYLLIKTCKSNACNGCMPHLNTFHLHHQTGQIFLFIIHVLEYNTIMSGQINLRQSKKFACVKGGK